MPVVEKNMNPDEGLNDILKVVVKDLNLVNDNTPSVDIFDLDYLEARIKQVSFEEQTTIVLSCNSMPFLIVQGVGKIILPF